MLRPPVFIAKESMILVGVGFFGDPFQISGDWTSENEIGRLWARFMAIQADYAGRMPTPSQPCVYYEVHLEHDTTTTTGEYEVFIGFEATRAEPIPPQLLLKILPPVTYAVFTLQGAEITSDWTQYIMREWLPSSGYRRAYRYGFQRYDRRFKGLDAVDESEIDVYIPIVPVSNEA